MIPILYESNETKFTSNGIGRLNDVISCVVTEEKNGSYELEMEYPITGRYFKDLLAGRFILVTPSYMTETQPFEIYKISKPLDGISTIYARHISYRLSLVPVVQFWTDGDAAQAFAMLGVQAGEPHPFNLYTNVTAKPAPCRFEEKEPASMRKMLGDICDYYGGEYEWNRYNVRLLSSRGSNKGVSIRYGKNLTDLKQEENIENTYTGMMPYWRGTIDGEDVVVNTNPRVIQIKNYDKYPYHRTKPVDITSYVTLNEDQTTGPTPEQMTAAVHNYIIAHGDEYGSLEVNLTVSFQSLHETEEYKNIAPLEHVNLCDTITVIFSELGVNSTAQIIETEWNVLEERYNSIQIGSAKSNLATSMAATAQAVDEKPSSDFLTDAINNATTLITGNSGGFVRLNRDSTGNPYELLIMDTADIATARNVWRFNKSGWGHSSTGYNGTYDTAATQDGSLVADRMTTGTLRAINITGVDFNNGNGTFHVDRNGNLTANSATIKGHVEASSGSFTGTVNATSGQFQGSVYASDGKIGPWTFNPQAFYNGIGIGNTGSCGISSIPGWAHWAGNGNFRVDENGYLFCNNANITGSITATSGSFTGEVHATSGSFTGEVHASSGSFTGSIYADSGRINNLECHNLTLSSGNGCSINAGGVTGTTTIDVVKNITNLNLMKTKTSVDGVLQTTIAVAISWNNARLKLINGSVLSESHTLKSDSIILHDTY